MILTGLEGDTTYISLTGSILSRVEDEGNMDPVREIFVVSPERKASQYYYYYLINIIR